MRRRFFLSMLHAARRLHRNGWEWKDIRAYLLGMQECYLNFFEDLNISENMRDVWMHQADHAE